MLSSRILPRGRSLGARRLPRSDRFGESSQRPWSAWTTFGGGDDQPEEERVSRYAPPSLCRRSPLMYQTSKLCANSYAWTMSSENQLSAARSFSSAAGWSPFEQSSAPVRLRSRDTGYRQGVLAKNLLYSSSIVRAGIDSGSQSSQFRQPRSACFSTEPKPSSKPAEVSQMTASSLPSKPNKSEVSSKLKSVVSNEIESSETSKSKSSMQDKVQEALYSATKTILTFLLVKLPYWTFWYLTHPTELKDALESMWEIVKHEANHYWIGTKLLYADVQTAGKLTRRTLQGSSLTRRERKQLLRTVSDLFRLVPFSMFVLIPFMEFALPFALRLFPNMLPSTFQDSLKAEESMKRELKSRIHMAQFFQDTLQEMAKEQKKMATKRIENAQEVEKEEKAKKQERSAAAMLEFLEKARSGELLPTDVIVQFASHFADDLTLDNMPRMQLINMCKYMNMTPYGSDNFLRFQLRHKIRSLVEDDQRILWEGMDSLTKMELREACQERGMRSTGLSKDAYKRSLQEWLDLSVSKHVPISLLIMSRIFFLRDEVPRSDDNDNKAVAGLADAISGLDQDIVNEVVLEVATAEESKSDPEIRKIKLEVLEAQNERILEEQRERDAVSKKKKKEQKEKEQAEASEEAEREAASKKKKEQAEASNVATDKTLESDVAVSPVPDTADISETEETAEKEEEKEYLSTQEMDAISQLINEDPLTLERAELERIKSAMAKAEEEGETEELEMIKASIESQRAGTLGADVTSVQSLDSQNATSPKADGGPMTAEQADKIAAATIIEMDKASAEAADNSTKMDIEATPEEEPEEVVDAQLDRTIESLKARVSRMVNKIESQLDTVEEKIGDKLHFLDKDGDGILSLAELADALRRVLKREFTQEEAMAIAALMDENKDGVFTVDEFSRWIETNKIVQLVKEGQDGELDRLLEKHSNVEDEEEPESPRATPKST